jgi:trk system potassium uptake protein TrkH
MTSRNTASRPRERRPFARFLPQRITITPPRYPGPRRANPAYVVYAFAALIALGTLLLMLPIAAREGSASFMVAWFTATSAVCVTGLVVVDTHDYWSPFGQAVILVLIKLGGLGLMTGATLLFLLAGRRISLRQRLMTGETLGRLGVAGMRRLVARIALLSVSIEATGAGLLLALDARDGLVAHDLWASLFTAISAFNNAGIDLEGGFQSLAAQRADVPFLLILMALVMLGGLGYAVMTETASQRRWQRFTLDTKIVLATNAVLWPLGAAMFFVLERETAIPLTQRVTDAAAMSVFARTAGFAVMDIATLQQATLVMLAGLMFIGGASASTAGGIKVSTFTALFFALLAAFRGDERVSAFGRELPTRQVYRALTVALLSVAVVFWLSVGLAALEAQQFEDLLFEAASVFGTAGLSTGVTRDLGSDAHSLLIIGMFVGRLGPLTIALALMQRASPKPFRYPEQEISIG